MESIPTLKMVVANGNEIICEEICRKFQWEYQGINSKQISSFTTRYLQLDLRNTIAYRTSRHSVEFQAIAYETLSWSAGVFDTR